MTTVKERLPEQRMSNAPVGRIIQKNNFKEITPHCDKIKQKKQTAFINRGDVRSNKPQLRIHPIDEQGNSAGDVFKVENKGRKFKKFSKLTEKDAKRAGYESLQQAKDTITKVMYKQPVFPDEIFTVTRFKYGQTAIGKLLQKGLKLLRLAR